MSTSRGVQPKTPVSLPPPPSPPSGPSSYSFVTGILVGQGSILVFIALFIRYVVFEDGATAVERRRKERKKRRSSQQSMGTSPPAPISSAEILSQTSYDLSSHPAESMDWLNVLLAQTLSNYRSSLLARKGDEGARETVEEWLNPGEGVSWLDPIRVTSLSLGTSYPLFSNARIRPSDSTGRMRAETELDYTDSVTLAISTSLVVNFPRPRFAVLPISLGITLVGLSGTMTTSLLSSPITPTSPTPHQSIQLSLQPDFALSISTTSLLGSRAKLQDLPKIEQLVASRLRQAIAERIVWPRFFAVGLPSLGIGISTTPGGMSGGRDGGGLGEDEFVIVDREDGVDAEGVAEGGEEGEGEGLGEKLMREVLLPSSPPTAGLGLLSPSGTGGRKGSVSRMIEEEGVLKRRSFDAVGGSSSQSSSMGGGGGGATGVRERGGRGGGGGGTSSSRPTNMSMAMGGMETGLGGGTGLMPGGSDWGDGRM